MHVLEALYDGIFICNFPLFSPKYSDIQENIAHTGYLNIVLHVYANFMIFLREENGVLVSQPALKDTEIQL